MEHRLSRARGLQQLRLPGSRGHRLSCCGAGAQLLRGTWDLPGPGIEPLSPSLASGFFTTEPSAKPLMFFLDQLLTVGECSHSHG